MTTRDLTSTSPAPASSARSSKNIALRVLQGVLAAFFLVAAAGPKLFGEATAVAMFDEIGAGQWFRNLVGLLELIGAIGLVIPRLARFAALGLAAVMVGAVLTSLFVLDAGWLTITPAILLALLGLVAWGRRPPTGR